MTSSGLKRPLDYEQLPAGGHISGSTPIANGVHGGTGVNVTTTTTGEPAGGGSGKRRCSDNYTGQQHQQPSNRSAGLTDLHHHLPFHQQMLANSAHGHVASSPFREPSTVLPSLCEDVASTIKNEVHRIRNLENNNYSNGAGNEQPPVLNERQTQLICEKIIKDREQKLRDEYDRILACKLAEQLDLFSKANYLNSYVDSSRMAGALSPPASSHTMNALAAAFNMRRSSAVVPAPNPTSNQLPDLSTFAASLSAANGHPSALSNSHLAYNLQQQAAAMQAQQQRVANNNPAIPSGPVLLASNLDEQLAIPEALFTLFGVFGDVIRVKILFNKKDNALIQMADANQAQVAQGYLDKQRVYGKIVRVTRSKHQLVQMPRDGNQSDAGLTKDFTNSPLHRFKIPGSRNYLNIYPPSNTLHISNIPATIDEPDLRKAFKEACDFDYASFKFFPKDRKMALMKFNSIEHATIALIKMHNYQISEDNNLRVSFSKSVMQQ